MKNINVLNRIIGESQKGDYMMNMNNSLELDESVRYAVETYHSSIIRVAFTYVKNISDAEDIAQDVFLALLEKNPVFENEEHKKAWLIRVAINKAKDYFKSHWFRNRTTLSEEVSYLPEEESGVLSAVMELDKKYRIPVHLYYYEGYSIEETAKILNSKLATIGTRLARARKILKEKLGGFDDE